MITKNKEVLNEILNRINCNQDEIVLSDLTTGEVIYMDDELKQLIKLYYEDKYQTACVTNEVK